MEPKGQGLSANIRRGQDDFGRFLISMTISIGLASTFLFRWPDPFSREVSCSDLAFIPEISLCPIQFLYGSKTLLKNLKTWLQIFLMLDEPSVVYPDPDGVGWSDPHHFSGSGPVSIPKQFQTHIFFTFLRNISVCCQKYLKSWHLCHWCEKKNILNWHCCEWKLSFSVISKHV